MRCHGCGHGRFISLGQLGLRRHYRCRACGLDMSVAPPPRKHPPESAADAARAFERRFRDIV